MPFLVSTHFWRMDEDDRTGPARTPGDSLREFRKPSIRKEPDARTVEKWSTMENLGHIITGCRSREHGKVCAKKMRSKRPELFLFEPSHNG